MYMGLDLGQSRDFTAIVVVERVSTAGQDEYHVRHCERLPLGTSYEDQKQYIKNLIARIEQHQKITLIVDATGVGRAVIDSMRGDGLAPVPVTVHGGQKETHDENGLHVPKENLVAVLGVLLRKRQLKIRRALPFADALTSELLTFDKDATSGHLTYEARRGAHDDLVLALSLACWYAWRESRRRDDEPVYIPRVTLRPNPHRINGSVDTAGSWKSRDRRTPF